MFGRFLTDEEVPKGKGEKSFWLKVVLCSIVPLSLISAVGAVLFSWHVFDIDLVQDIFHYVGLIAASLWVIGCVTAMVEGILGNIQIASGMGFGLIISLVPLAASLFVNFIFSDF